MTKFIVDHVTIVTFNKIFSHFIYLFIYLFSLTTKMSIQFFPKLSQNFIELLEDDEYYDITIEVGEDPNIKIFRAHTGILCYRSSYLRRYLASNKRNNDNVLTHVKLSNISPNTFQIILK
jgi:hypothetical protein